DQKDSGAQLPVLLHPLGESGLVGRRCDRDGGGGLVLGHRMLVLASYWSSHGCQTAYIDIQSSPARLLGVGWDLRAGSRSGSACCQTPTSASSKTDGVGRCVGRAL